MRCNCGRIISRYSHGKCLACRYEDEKAMLKIKCRRCGKIFRARYPQTKYCSDECRNPTRDLNLICPICGKHFVQQQKGQKFCSPECAKIRRKQWQLAHYAKEREERAEKRARKKKTATTIPYKPPAILTDVYADAKPALQNCGGWFGPIPSQPQGGKAIIRCNPSRLPKPLLPPTVSERVADPERKNPYYAKKLKDLRMHAEIGSMSNPNAYTKEDEQLIMDMHKAGATNTEIALKVNRSPNAVRIKIWNMEQGLK